MNHPISGKYQKCNSPSSPAPFGHHGMPVALRMEAMGHCRSSLCCLASTRPLIKPGGVGLGEAATLRKSSSIKGAWWPEFRWVPRLGCLSKRGGPGVCQRWNLQDNTPVQLFGRVYHDNVDNLQCKQRSQFSAGMADG